MNKKEFYKKLIIFAIPIMIQFLITSSINMMDTIMIGTLGEQEIASLGIANQYFFLFNLIIMGIYSGCNVLIAQFWGRKDVINIKKVLGFSLILGVIVSFIFILGSTFFDRQIMYIFSKDNAVISIGAQYLSIVCLSYLFMAVSQAFGIASRGIGKAVLPMVSSASGLFFNIVFNYILIFGHFGFPALGVKGAAIATVIARFIEMSVIVLTIYFKKDVLAAKLSELLDQSLDFAKKAFVSIIPVITNEMCWGGGMIIYSVIYGRIGTEAMAAIQICTTVQNFFMIVLFGIANASCVMVGNKIGEDDIDGGKAYCTEFIKISIVASFIMACLLLLSSQTILSFYTISPQVYKSSWYILAITAVILPIRFMNILLIVGILRGGGDAQYAMKIELVTMWLVGVPVSFIGAFILQLPVYIVYGLITIEEVLKCIISFKRYRSAKWIKNIISDMEAAA